MNAADMTCMRLAVPSDMFGQEPPLDMRPHAPPHGMQRLCHLGTRPGWRPICMRLGSEDPHAARRMSMKRLAVGLCLLSLAPAAEAYVGPGMGLGVFAAVLGFLTAILLAVAGMDWYPLKRM